MTATKSKSTILRQLRQAITRRDELKAQTEYLRKHRAIQVHTGPADWLLAEEREHAEARQVVWAEISRLADEALSAGCRPSTLRGVIGSGYGLDPVTAYTIWPNG